MRLPNDAEICAAATDLGLLDADGTLPQASRARAAKAAAEQLAKPKATEREPAGTLLSRSVVQVGDGHLVIDVTHYPAAPRPS